MKKRLVEVPGFMCFGPFGPPRLCFGRGGRWWLVGDGGGFPGEDEVSCEVLVEVGGGLAVVGWYVVAVAVVTEGVRVVVGAAAGVGFLDPDGFVCGPWGEGGYDACRHVGWVVGACVAACAEVYWVAVVEDEGECPVWELAYGGFGGVAHGFSL